jgi:hypothetical protein
MLMVKIGHTVQRSNPILIQVVELGDVGAVNVALKRPSALADMLHERFGAGA